MEGLPGSDIIVDDISTELSIGKEEMLYALNSTLEALEDESILEEEYYVTFDTPGFQHQSGCPSNPNPHDFELLKSAVRSTFEAVELGYLTEDDYYFALITPYFYYRSGNYHKAGNLECTLQALIDTYDEESGNELLQEHIVSTFLEWIDSNNKFAIVFHPAELENEIPEVEADSVGSTHGPFDFIDWSPAKDEQIDKGTFQMLLGVMTYLLKISRLLDSKKGTFQMLLGVMTYLLKISRLLDSKKRGSGADKRNTSGIKLQLKNCTLILFLGLFAGPIPSVQAAHQETPLTLRAGSNGVIPFNFTVRDPLDMLKVFYALRFEAKILPFCVDGVFDPGGFISPDQSGRFSTKLNVNIDTLAVSINIEPVSAEDEGTYELQTHCYFGPKDVESQVMTKIVKVHVPPGPAMCYFMNNAGYAQTRLLRCHCRPGNGNSTLTCFQNGERVPYIDPNEVVTSRTSRTSRTWVMNETTPVVCCSHELGEEVTADSCGKQFRFPRHQAKTTVPPRTRSKEGPVAEGFPKPTNDNMLPTSNEEPVGSGYAMRGSILFSSLLPLFAFLTCK